MELKIAVIDDLRHDIDNVIDMTEQYIDSTDKTIKADIQTFSDGQSFFNTFTKGMLHAVFLDICMDKMSGIELSRRLRAIDDNIAIVFMSTTTEYVFETFEATPFGYLVKPFTFEQFSKVMNKIVNHFSKVSSSIHIKIPRSQLTIDLDSIYSVVSSGHTTLVNTTSGESINSTEKYEFFKNNLLNEQNFAECNRGIIINLDCVLTIKNNDIVMHNNTLYPLRTRNKKELIFYITRYIAEKMKGEL